MDKLTELSSALLMNLGEEEPLQKIMNTGYSFLNNPLHLTDTTGKLLAKASGAPPVDEIWHNIEKRGYIDYETYIHTCLPNINIINKNYAPVIIKNAPGNVNLLVFNITENNLHIANIIAIEKFSAFTDEDKAVIKLLGRTLALLLKKQQISGLKTPKEFFLYDLLSTPEQSAKDLQERRKIVNLKHEKSYQLLTIYNPGKPHLRPVFHGIRQLTSAIWPEAPGILYNNRLIILLGTNQLSEEKAEASGLMHLLKESRLSASLSLPFKSLTETWAAYMQTLQTLDYGALIHDNRCYYEYRDYMVYHTLSMVNHPDDFCHPCIGALIAYDQLHQTDYTKTLYLYTMNFCSLKNTAMAMNVHYNTLKYRLKKIYGLIETGRPDPDLFMLLYLSFKVMQLNGHIF